MNGSEVKEPGWYRWAWLNHAEIVRVTNGSGVGQMYSCGDPGVRLVAAQVGEFAGPIDLNAPLPPLGKEAEIRKDFETRAAHAENSALEAAERVATQWAEGVINQAEFRAGMREAFGLTPSGPGTLLIGSNCGVPSDG